MTFASVVIVSPALADANNGNWRTAQRWQQMLADSGAARIVRQWPDAAAAGDSVMLALHARRSAASIRAWAETHPRRGLAVVLTGTDLYQDLAVDSAAQRSLQLAQRLVVLQDCAPEALAPAERAKARVVYQSAPTAPAAARPRDHLQALMVGHLRHVKTPQTLFEAARLLRTEEGITLTHVGDDAGEPALGALARATALACPHYAWLGPLPHAATLQRVAAAHVLVHTSALEGGAHVISEAVRSATPVLASRIPGNIGMLGPHYDGYFAHGDAAGLVHLLRACRAGLDTDSPAASLLARLAAQCAQRAPLFEPQAERAALLRLVNELQSPP